MKLNGWVWILSGLLLAGCQTSEPQRAGAKPVAEEKKEGASEPAVSQEQLRALIVVPSETPADPVDKASLKEQILIPSEVEENPKRDLRSMIVVPSEVVEGKQDLRSRIFVPSES